MKNVWIVLALAMSAIFLSHCGRSTSDGVAPPLVTDLKGNECIAGVYSGKGDVRVERFGEEDINVSIAFSGDSMLVKVDGEDDDLLCTRYQGVQFVEEKAAWYKLEFFDDRNIITANRISSSRAEDSSVALAASLGAIEMVQSDEDQAAACNFSIRGNKAVGGKALLARNIVIESTSLNKSADQADYNLLLAECGGIEAFDFVYSEVEAKEEAAEEGEGS